MIDPRNLINLTGGVVTDVELVNDKIGKFRFAVDYAGSEKGSDNTSGYFDIVYYLRDSKGDFIGKNALKEEEKNSYYLFQCHFYLLFLLSGDCPHFIIFLAFMGSGMR